MVGGPNLLYVRVEPSVAQCIITALVVAFGCACSECPSFFGGDNDIYILVPVLRLLPRAHFDGSHLDMLYHMMTQATPCTRYSNTLAW